MSRRADGKYSKRKKFVEIGKALANAKTRGDRLLPPLMPGYDSDDEEDDDMTGDEVMKDAPLCTMLENGQKRVFLSWCKMKL